MKRVLAVVLPLTAFALMGCTTTQTHTAAGAGAGAAVGGIIGNQVGGQGDRDKGVAIGAAVGGLVGHELGANKEAQENAGERMDYLERQAISRQVWITNSNGSRSPVTLTQGQGGTWIGPRGEYYSDFPTEAQLKKVYGF